ncbi:MAG: hypothetical protein M1835_002597 [Candelina submexicana]|nr:MAG: hypothetical protein M1835_002597 [Candelina submexicana]
MTPRFDDWPAGGTDFWVNSTQHDLWPSRINASHIPRPSCFEDQGDESCPYGNWRTLAEEYFEYWPRLNEMDTMPETTQIPSPKSVRELYSRGRKGLYRNRFTVATTQHSVMADAVADTAKFWLYAALNIKQIEAFRFRKDATFTVDAYQPVTHVRCNAQTWSNNTSYLPVFPVLSYQNGDMFPQRSYSDNGVAQLFVQQSALKQSGPQLHWLELPMSTFGNSSIGAMILLPQDTSGISLLMCNIDARWSANKIQSFRDNIKVVTGTSNAWLDPSTYSASWPHIAVSPDWARYLNPLISGSNTTTVFQNLAAVAGLSEGTNPAPLIAESILSIMMTNGLSRINYSRALVGLLTGSSDNSSSFSWKCSKWCNEMLPSKYFSFGRGGTAFTLPEDITGPTARFTMEASVKGYAYSSRGTPAKVAIGLMILYCIVAILHYIYLCMTGISSSSWDSISEITTLAMNSKPTGALRGTSAGIDTLEVFKKRVRIVVADENHLEMTFQDDSAHPSIVTNAYYS